jgi:hypothetical protein
MAASFNVPAVLHRLCRKTIPTITHVAVRSLRAARDHVFAIAIHAAVQYKTGIPKPRKAESMFSLIRLLVLATPRR